MTSSASNITLTPSQAATLLELLQSDDTFRAAFAADPTTALVSIGATVGPNGSCCTSVTALADKAEFAAAAAQLQAHLEVHGAFNLPYAFEAGQVQDSLDG